MINDGKNLVRFFFYSRRCGLCVRLWADRERRVGRGLESRLHSEEHSFCRLRVHIESLKLWLFRLRVPISFASNSGNLRKEPSFVGSESQKMKGDSEPTEDKIEVTAGLTRARRFPVIDLFSCLNWIPSAMMSLQLAIKQFSRVLNCRRLKRNVKRFLNWLMVSSAARLQKIANPANLRRPWRHANFLRIFKLKNFMLLV